MVTKFHLSLCTCTKLLLCILVLFTDRSSYGSWSCTQNLAYCEHVTVRTLCLPFHYGFLDHMFCALVSYGRIFSMQSLLIPRARQRQSRERGWRIFMAVPKISITCWPCSTLLTRQQHLFQNVTLASLCVVLPSVWGRAHVLQVLEDGCTPISV